MKRFLRSPRRVLFLVIIAVVSFRTTVAIATPSAATHQCFTQHFQVLPWWGFDWQYCPTHAPDYTPDPGSVFDKPIPSVVPIIIEVPKRIVNCCP